MLPPSPLHTRDDNITAARQFRLSFVVFVAFSPSCPVPSSTLVILSSLSQPFRVRQPDCRMFTSFARVVLSTTLLTHRREPHMVHILCKDNHLRQQHDSLCLPKSIQRSARAASRTSPGDHVHNWSRGKSFPAVAVRMPCLCLIRQSYRLRVSGRS